MKKSEIINKLKEELRHDDYCQAFESNGTLKKLTGMMPNICNCSKALTLNKVNEDLNKCQK